MKRVVILVVAICLFLCSTASAFQGGGGESTKKGSNKKKEDIKNKNSGTKSVNTTPPRRSASRAPTVRVFGPGLSVDLGNNVTLELVLIKAGNFTMGSTDREVDEALANWEGSSRSRSELIPEQPAHPVNITKPFYLGKYEVTQGQWQAVMGNNPSYFKNCDICPVEQVSWEDVQQFLAKLNERNDGYTYRLPSEAEWEYGGRAGTTGDYAGDLDTMAWYGNNSGRARLDAAEIWRTASANYEKRIAENGGQTHAVGTKQPNAFGLFDMHGNVFEWCEDLFHPNYAGAPSDGRAWLSGQQKSRVVRGGSWFLIAPSLRSAARGAGTPDYRSPLLGVRVVAVR